MEAHVSGALSKQFVVARREPGEALAQLVVRMRDVVGALADINAITAKEGADIRQSSTYSVPTEGYAIFNAFIDLEGRGDLERVLLKLRRSKFVLDATGVMGEDGTIVDTLTFPIEFAGDRVVLLSASGIELMFAAMRETFGSGGSVILFQAGMYYGKSFGERLGSLVGGKKTVKSWEYGLQMLASTGLGTPRVLRGSDDLAKATVSVDESFECNPRDGGPRTGYFMGGVLSGIISHLSGKDVRAQETRCRSSGDPRCEFEVS